MQTGLAPSHLAFLDLQLKQAALTGPSFNTPPGPNTKFLDLSPFEWLYAKGGEVDEVAKSTEGSEEGVEEDEGG